jgi:hypothetical protein
VEDSIRKNIDKEIAISRISDVEEKPYMIMEGYVD